MREGIPRFYLGAPKCPITNNDNRVTVPTAWTYDGAANVMAIGGMQRSFTYDAENRQISATVNGQTSTYTYDGEGRRVKKSVNGVDTVFVYDPFGNLAQEYAPAPTDTGTKYITADHLGSTRLVTTSAGAADKCYDYLPFGEEIGAGTAARPTGGCFGGSQYPSAADKSSNKFTSKERDSETGLDYFGARYFSSAQGRFTSPDAPFIDQHILDPQSWNLYSYGRNNPLLYVDPSGNAIELLGDEDERKKALKVLADSVGEKAGNKLYINEVKDGKNTRYFVGVQGSLSDFAKIGDAAKRMADFVGAKQVVEFGLTDQALPGAGAGQAANTYAPGEIGNQNVRILLNPKLAAELNPTGLMRQKWNSGILRSMTPQIAAWHELGHAWAMWQDMNARSMPAAGIIAPDMSRGLGMGGAVQKANDFENRIRQDLYGPLGPNNARRIFH
ncbi:MAG: RHS repeat-associated core domain-containing protein [Bryobacteraceae bacterium]